MILFLWQCRDVFWVLGGRSCRYTHSLGYAFVTTVKWVRDRNIRQLHFRVTQQKQRQKTCPSQRVTQQRLGCPLIKWASAWSQEAASTEVTGSPLAQARPDCKDCGVTDGASWITEHQLRASQNLTNTAQPQGQPETSPHRTCGDVVVKEQPISFLREIFLVNLKETKAISFLYISCHFAWELSLSNVAAFI